MTEIDPLKIAAELQEEFSRCDVQPLAENLRLGAACIRQLYEEVAILKESSKIISDALAGKADDAALINLQRYLNSELLKKVKSLVEENIRVGETNDRMNDENSMQAATIERLQAENADLRKLVKAWEEFHHAKSVAASEKASDMICNLKKKMGL